MFGIRRDPEKFGDVTLSVQASSSHYCSPRQDLQDIAEFSSVEIAVINSEGKLCLPSSVGVDGFDQLFEDGDSPVAGWVPTETVEQIREALRSR